MMKLIFNDASEFEVSNIFTYGTDMDTLCVEILDQSYSDIETAFSDPTRTSTIKVYNGNALISTYSDYCSIKSISTDYSYYIDTELHSKTILYLSQTYTKQKLQMLTERVNNISHTQESLQKEQSQLSSKQTSISEKQEIITEKVSAIDQQINPVIDIEKLSLEELKGYKVKEFGAACNAIIFAGTDIETSRGIEHFSYTETDQLNIKSTFESAKLGLPVPYHADGEDCRLFDPTEVLMIYGACELFKTYQTTYCNLMNNIIKATADLEYLKDLTYGAELPEEKQVKLQQSMQQVQSIFESIKSELLKALSPIEADQEEDTEIKDDIDDEEPAIIP